METKFFSVKNLLIIRFVLIALIILLLAGQLVFADESIIRGKSGFSFDLDANDASSVTISIPTIGVNANILGVPYENRTWDTSWLGDNVGLLEYRTNIGATENGNIILSGHNTNFSGYPGVFANLHLLRNGDLVIIHAYGETFTYRVFAYYETDPEDISPFNHSDDKAIMTLITCRYWNEAAYRYDKRVVVQAELISVE